MKWSVAAAGLGLALFMAGCSNQNESKPPKQKMWVEHTPFPQHNPSRVLATDLKVPWDIIKHGPTFYVSERPGQIVKITADGKVEKMPLHLKKVVIQNGEGGLPGFVLSPDFDTSHTAYIYHTYQENHQLFNRIVRIKWTGKSWTEQDVLLDHIPGAPIHNGGRLKIGPDGKLYATVGDASVRQNAQDLHSLSGKILRMNRDGSIPKDNPFPHSYVYSYGHRNPQGLAWSEDGKMYDAEHGPSGHDEINLIKPGKNYGWPVVTGNETRKGMIPPLFQSGEDTWAPSGLAYNKGTLYIAGLRGSQIRAFDLKNHQSKIVFQGVGRLRDIIIQGGAAYVITNNTDGRGNPGPHDDRFLKIAVNDFYKG